MVKNIFMQQSLILFFFSSLTAFKSEQQSFAKKWPIWMDWLWKEKTPHMNFWNHLKFWADEKLIRIIFCSPFSGSVSDCISLFWSAKRCIESSVCFSLKSFFSFSFFTSLFLTLYLLYFSLAISLLTSLAFCPFPSHLLFSFLPSLCLYFLLFFISLVSFSLFVHSLQIIS